MEWLGVNINMREFSIRIPERRISKAMNTIKLLLGSEYMPVRKVASFIGQIISMSIVIGPVAQIMTRYFSIDVSKERKGNSNVNCQSVV